MVHRELIVPNFHVVLVHYPMALVTLGLVMEILGGLIWRRHPARAVGRWLLLLGGLSMLPAALSGLYALRDVASINNPTPYGTWATVKAAAPISAEQWHNLSMHVLLMSIATATVLLVVVGYLAASNRLRDKLYWLFLLLLLIGSGLMGSSAWFAGEAIYRGGVAVKANEPDQSPTTKPTKGRQLLANLDVMFPPVQTHVVFAGFAAAFALAAVGLSIRQITGEEPEPEVSDAEALVQSLQPPAPPRPLYPARFWIVAMVLFLLTGLIGAYMLQGADTTSLKDIWSDITAPPDPGDGAVTRSLAHFIAGSALVVLPLLLAILARFAPKRKGLLAAFTALLILALAAQLWLGILLLFDGSSGTIFRFAGK